jgi:hypothetical protein
MSGLLFDAPEVKTIPVAGEADLYPVHRIFCVGRNYAAHAAEMGVEVDREAPFYFCKTPSATIPSGATIAYPPGTENYHFEMEFVIAIGQPLFKADLVHAKDALGISAKTLKNQRFSPRWSKPRQSTRSARRESISKSMAKPNKMPILPI